MSNESQSPPLRLKPRLSSVQPVPTPENPPANPAPAGTPANSQMPPLATPVAPPPLRTVIPAPLPPERVPGPVSPTPAPPPAAEDPGKFKLKPRGATPAAAAPVAASAPNPATPASNVPAPASPPRVPTAEAAPLVMKPTLPAAALASPAFAPPTAPTLPGRPNMPIAPLPPSAPVAMPTGGPGPRPQGKLVSQTSNETEAARGKFALKLLMALLFVAFVLGGVFAYNLWFAEDSAPATIVAKPAPAPKSADADATPASAETAPAAAATNDVPAPTATPTVPPVVVDNPQSALGQQVAKAQAAVAAHDAAVSQPVDELLKASEAPAVSADQATASAADTATPAAAETASVATPAPAPVRPEPSPAFKSFVVNLKVNGVFQGENARAMINGKMYRLGEVVDAKLGIVFARLEPEDKRIVFEDGKGAIMSRRY